MGSILTYLHNMKQAGNLVDYSVGLARDLKKEVDLLSTVNLKNFPLGIPIAEPPHHKYDEMNVGEIMKELNSEMRNEVIKVKRRIKNPPRINFFTERGVSYKVIQQYVNNNRYDFIVVSANTENEYLINDRNMDIIKHNEPPVWVIPHNAEYQPVESIIFATDLEEDDIPTMKKVAELAEKSAAKISAVHVVDDQEKKSRIEKAGTSEDLIKKVGYDNIELVTLLREKDKRPDQVINEFAKRIGSTLIVVVKENKSFFEKLFRRSTTKDLIDVSDIPVLVFHEDIFKQGKD